MEEKEIETLYKSIYARDSRIKILENYIHTLAEYLLPESKWNNDPDAEYKEMIEMLDKKEKTKRRKMNTKFNVGESKRNEDPDAEYVYPKRNEDPDAEYEPPKWSNDPDAEYE